MTEAAVLDGLRALGLVDPDAAPVLERLEGGVSSDIWRVDGPKDRVCVKRALARLKTEREWRAPVERNASEAAWMRAVAAILPDAVPKPIAEDRARGLFVMEYLDPGIHPVWKTQLRDGVVRAETAEAVGATLGAVHAAFAGDPETARRFATDGIFHAIRIEPYLLRTASVHGDLADRLGKLAEVTAATRKTLVHGDVSPKNILAGPAGPVFLDAECAWYGDPAFDVAFCLNHLLLKCLWRPRHADAYLEAFAALAAGYFGHADWESPARLEARAAALLGGLMLARVDGASPVEYLVSEDDKNRVRKAARRALLEPPETLAGFCRLFREEAGT